MTDIDLRQELLALASNYRMRSDNLLSDDWDESYRSMPTLRQRQYGQAIEAGILSDRLMALLGMDPLPSTGGTLPPLPEEERGRLTWTAPGD